MMAERMDARHVRRAHHDRGASLVEFAILAPLVFMLIFGMITGGMALSYKNSMTNAVREGARLGATLESGPNWATDVRARVLELSSGDLTPDQVCVKLETSIFATSIGSECAGLEPATPASGGCVVKVWARRDADLNAILFQRTLTLDADAIGRYEGEEPC
jgi:hypothetical protein